MVSTRDNSATTEIRKQPADVIPLKWTNTYFGEGLSERESYKLEFRHDPLTGDFQYRYRPDGPHHSGSGEITGIILPKSLVVTELVAALQGIVDDDDAGVSLDEQRARWGGRMKAARAAISKAEGK